MKSTLRPGDRIRLKARTLSGWSGYGTVTFAEQDLVVFRRDGRGADDQAIACRAEVTRLRNQSAPTGA